MKTKILLSVLAMVLYVNAFGQRNSIDLTFTAIDSAAHVQLDSIKVMNLTRGSDTVLYWPDTVLVLNYLVGIPQVKANSVGMQLFQNYPNPVTDETSISLYIPEKAVVNCLINDILGRQIISTKILLDKGLHHFNFKPGQAEIYFFTVSTQEANQTIKIISTVKEKNPRCTLNYLGIGSTQSPMKKRQAIQEFIYLEGDELLHIGYRNSEQSGMLDSPVESKTYTFQFATNIPCPGTPTVDYGGQIYNTIQVYSQCWMKENLNVGLMLQSPEMPTDNDTIEKYCMADLLSFCNTYGGLYHWNEMMKYTSETGGQGICPDGWHVPDDLDWQLLEGAVDSIYKIGNNEWRKSNWRGMDAGGRLKEKGTQHWEPPNNGATDAYEFTALPGGYYVQNAFWGIGYKGYFWSSTINPKYWRNIDWNQIRMNRGSASSVAISVRCVKDND